MILKSGTWPALEFLKALAIASMTFIHTWGYSVDDFDLQFNKYSLALRMGNIIHFFCFFNIWIPAIAGSTLRLQGTESSDEVAFKRTLAKTSFTWGLVLISAGFIFSRMVDRLEPFLWYDPLHFMGFVFVIMSLLIYFLGARSILIFSILIYIGSCFTGYLKSHYVSSPPFHIYERMGTDWGPPIKNYLMEIVFGSSRIGWSFFPWAVSVFCGFSFADYLLKSKSPQKLLQKTTVISLIVVVFCLAAPESIDFIKAQNISDQYSSLAMPFKLFTAVTAGYLFLLSLITLCYPKNGLGSISPIISALSRGSFWIFFLQFPLLCFFKPSFEARSFLVRVVVFPVFMLMWGIAIGGVVIELGKKKLVINIVKSEKPR